MRILFLTSRIPYPPNRGDKLRVYNFLKTLSADHEIHLVSFIVSKSENVYVPELRDFCSEIRTINQTLSDSMISMAINFFDSTPLQVNFYKSNRMVKELQDINQNFHYDIVYAHLVRMAPYSGLFPEAYKILDLTDLISEEIRRSLVYRNRLSQLMYKFELRKMACYEMSIVDNFQECWLISPQEMELFYSRHLVSNVFTVKNGVDFGTYFPQNLERQRNQLIFVGHMSVYHNIDAVEYLCKEILPGVREIIPEIELLIIGAEPARRVRALGQFTGVHVSGYVQDLASYLNQASLFVAPLRFSAGIQNKILEAMATATPVIASPQVNQGIGAVDGVHIVLAERADDYITAIVSMVRNPDECERVGKAGYEYVKQNFSWNHVNARIQSIQDQFSGSGKS